MDRQTMIQEMESRVRSVVGSKFPITEGEKTLELVSIDFGPADTSIQHELQLKNSRGTLARPVTLTMRLKSKDGDEIIKQRLMNMPFPSLRNTLIIGGNEKVMMGQMTSKNGVFTTGDEEKTVTSIRLKNLPMGLQAVYSRGKMSIAAGNVSVPVTSFFKILGMSEMEMSVALGMDEFGRAIREKSIGGTNNVDKLYNIFGTRVKPNLKTESEKTEAIRAFFSGKAELTDEEREVIGVTLGSSALSVDYNLIKEAIQKTVRVAKEEDDPDDRDDLLFQEVKSGADIFEDMLSKSMSAFARDVHLKLQNPKTADKRYISASKFVSRPMNKFFSTDSRVSNSETTNPLLMAVEASTIVSTGEGGLSSDMLRNNRMPRNLKATGVNRFDPVHTPESGKIGLSLRLTQDAEIQNRTIVAPVLRVVNGTAEDLDANVVKLTPMQEYNSYVAYHSPRHVTKLGKKISFLGTTVPGRHKGLTMDIPVDKIQYIDRKPQQLFDMATNMIPFANHSDGNRMLMGANMQTQAVNLKYKEAPLVKVRDADGVTFEKKLGEQSFIVKAPVSGKVKLVERDKIVIETDDGKDEVVDIYDYFPMNRGYYINNEPTVKPGETVKAGDLIADGWQTKNGEAALGVNTRIGYAAYEGYNFEDGLVVSQSYANKMTSEEMIVEEVVIKDIHVGGRGSKAKSLYQTNITSSASLAKLDDDGIIKVGEEVAPGDILVIRLKEKSSRGSIEAAAYRSVILGQTVRYSDASDVIPPHSYTKGKVVSVTIQPGQSSGEKESIVIRILTEKPLKEQDKISGRHGNKGTVSLILPDDEMPRTEDGHVLDVLMSPLAIPSRKNLSSVLEANAGLVAEKKGLSEFLVDGFDDNSKAQVEQGLAEIGIPDGKVKVINPKTGKAFENPVTVGIVTTMKLKHKADDKIQARSAEEGAAPNAKFFMPSKQIGTASGEKHNPQSMGEMEIRALQAHGAKYNLMEATSLKGDGAGDAADRINIFRVLSGREDPSTLKHLNGTPQSLRVFKDLTQAAGLNVAVKNSGEASTIEDHFDSMMVTPYKDSDLVKMIGKNNHVTEGLTFFASKKSGDKAEKGGLFDEDIFGPKNGPDPGRESRKKWGYITMPMAMPNPVLESNVSYNPYRILTGLNASDYENLVRKGSHVLITNPGATGLGKFAVISKDKAAELDEEGISFSYAVGGNALEEMLKEIKVDTELSQLEKELKSGVHKGKNLDAAYKKYRVLKNLSDNKLGAEDLVTRVIPVAPSYVRPDIRDGETVQSDDLNKLYTRIVIAKKGAESALSDPELVTVDDQVNAFNSLYANYKNLIGTTRVAGADGEELKGIKQQLFGDKESKQGLIRSKMLSKRQDYSGRAVIGVDPTLGMDEAVLPSEMARFLYKPFIQKELVGMGAARSTMDAADMMKNLNDPKVKEAMRRAVENRPVMLNRAPSLHKFSVQGFKPILKDYDEMGNPIRSIRINPLVVGGFNADFDGDTMAAHIPLTESARKEALEQLMPSKNLINPGNGTIIAEVKHEMVQGIFYMTMKHDSPNPVPAKNFDTVEALKKAYERQDVATHDPVTIAGRTTTAGQFIFNMSLPQKFRRWNQAIGKKELDTIIREMYDDKEVGAAVVVQTMERLKNIGFKAATISGLSIGIKDFVKPKESTLRLQETVQAVDENLAKNPGSYVAAFMDIEAAIQNEYNDKSKNPMDESNPVRILMQSGARGNADQIRRMAVTVGVGKDIAENLTMPVVSSHLDGLMPHEYYSHAKDARKGLADRALSTSKPGELTRNIWAAVQDVTISERDCRTKDGILKVVDNKIVGRFLAVDIPGAARAGDVISKDVYDKLKQASMREVKVRSPMTCESTKGVCQKCYGMMPGTMDKPTLGAPVGVIASQSIGEPAMQMTMNTFHTGGTSSNLTAGLPRFQSVIAGKADGNRKAVLATCAGSVVIDEVTDPKHIIVRVAGKEHLVRRDVQLAVTDGQFIQKGDFLTVGGHKDFLNNALVNDKSILFPTISPNEIIALRRGEVGEKTSLIDAKQYMANQMDYSISKALNGSMGSKVDSRHLELIADRLGDKVKIIHGGDSDFIPGSYVSRKVVDKYNRERKDGFFDAKRKQMFDRSEIVGHEAAEDVKVNGIILVQKDETIDDAAYNAMQSAGVKDVKVYPMAIHYEGEIRSLGKAVKPSVNENWFSNLGSEAGFGTLGAAAATGAVDSLSDPRGRQMAGLLQNFGEVSSDAVKGIQAFTGSLGKTIAGFFS